MPSGFRTSPRSLATPIWFRNAAHRGGHHRAGGSGDPHRGLPEAERSGHLHGPSATTSSRCSGPRTRPTSPNRRRTSAPPGYARAGSAFGPGSRSLPEVGSQVAELVSASTSPPGLQGSSRGSVGPRNDSGLTSRSDSFLSASPRSARRLPQLHARRAAARPVAVHALRAPLPDRALPLGITRRAWSQSPGYPIQGLQRLLLQLRVHRSRSREDRRPPSPSRALQARPGGRGRRSRREPSSPA